MNTRILKVARELRYMYGRFAAINLFCVMRKEVKGFVGIHADEIRAYCEFRGVL